jgi:hypothetical protein
MLHLTSNQTTVNKATIHIYKASQLKIGFPTKIFGLCKNKIYILFKIKYLVFARALC